jgi:DNA-binding MarR family transcriptional regulator
MENHEEVLLALRRIIRAVDIQSRKLIKSSGLTGPQLIVMHSIRDMGQVTISALSKHVHLSQATVSSILDRLELKGFVKRERSKKDKRATHAMLTAQGIVALDKSPTLLQESFIHRFQGMKEWEQTQILSSVQRLAEMMDAQDIEASPMLEVAPIPSNGPKEGNT